MDGIIELAIAVGRLEQRVKELEQRGQGPKYTVSPIFGQEEDKTVSDRLLQEGIDNIMGYQWPPAKRDEE